MNGFPVMAMEVSVAEVTVKGAEPVFVSMVALTFAVPAATPVTVPRLLTVAAAVLLEAQTTWLDRSCVEASLNVPTAVKVSFAAG